MGLWEATLDYVRLVRSLPGEFGRASVSESLNAVRASVSYNIWLTDKPDLNDLPVCEMPMPRCDSEFGNWTPINLIRELVHVAASNPFGWRRSVRHSA